MPDEYLPAFTNVGLLHRGPLCGDVGLLFIAVFLDSSCVVAKR